ncbi:uncharacterized protein [Primulina huaijiensis]|uniref:uncharacterized protein isoform X2 n=1 Tax=Primulina huaijiensis TaxID=1492673 RepID=UPI003CC78BD2
MGMAHVFRQLPMTAPAAVLSTVANVSIRTTLVFVVAVPNYMSADDFLIFCGPHPPALSISSSSERWIQMLVEDRARCVTIHFNVLVLRSGPTCLARWKKGEWDQ